MFNAAGWCVAIVVALSTLYGKYSAVRKDNPKPFTRAENIIYGTFSHCAWGLALAWVIFACHRGLGGRCQFVSQTTGSPESQQHTGSQIIRICMEIYLKIDKMVKMYKNSY